jgi:hypothetical protein
MHSPSGGSIVVLSAAPLLVSGVPVVGPTLVVPPVLVLPLVVLPLSPEPSCPPLPPHAEASTTSEVSTTSAGRIGES